MTKTAELKDDGRFIFYYSFGNSSDKSAAGRCAVQITKRTTGSPCSKKKARKGS